MLLQAWDAETHKPFPGSSPEELTAIPHIVPYAILLLCSLSFNHTHHEVLLIIPAMKDEAINASAHSFTALFCN